MREYGMSSGSPAGEMAIVDTFTRLIFGEQDPFSESELLIIQAFRLVDDGVARDGYAEMGQYLRALGVAEMIKLVTRVQAQLAGGLQVVSQGRGLSILDRRAH